MKKTFYIFLFALCEVSSGAAQVSIVKYVNWYLQPNQLTKVGNFLYFVASDTYEHEQIWKSDGTANGTVMVTDLTNVGAWWAQELTDVNGTLFFRARTVNHGSELWKSNGTAAGTFMVRDIYPGSNGSGPEELTALGQTVFFVCDDGVHGRELWKSDGTNAGTALVKDYVAGPEEGYIHDLVAMGNRLFFSAGSYVFHNFAGLHKTDGSPAGTQLVKYFPNGTPVTPISGNGTLFFTISEGFDNGAVWRSDGTTAGTQLAQALCDDISDLAVVNNTLFLDAKDCLNYPDAYSELFKIGTNAANSGLVKDICPNGTSNIRYLTTVGNLVYFSADDCTNGEELWKSDGLANGTVMVKNIRYGYASSSPQELTSSNGLLYFTADPGEATAPVTGRELWRSNGSETGTFMVMDIRPGASGSEPKELTDVNNILFFTAFDGQNGTQLWRTGGTVYSLSPEPTEPMSIVPNPASHEIRLLLPDEGIQPATLHILDINGHHVMSVDLTTASSAVQPISIGHLPNGVYVAQLAAGTRVWMTKLVKI